ncbi:MAG: CHASE domain-containing protein, partial [Deltaproteobacteria bacterium]|nr:CHASE domain-containing protein [Deltaproteobacteria bacterium]
LVQERQQPGFLVFVPVYNRPNHPKTMEDRREKLIGFALGVFKVNDMIERALAGLDMGRLDFNLQEIIPGRKAKIIYRYDSIKRTSPETGVPDQNDLPVKFKHITKLALPGKDWSITFIPEPQYLVENFSWWVWGALSGCMLFTALLGTFLLLISGEEHKVSLLVIERTSELVAANDELEKQIAERYLAEEQ